MSKTTKNIIISFVIALCACTLLWINSDAPPYGKPVDEINNSYYGIIMQIAHKWQSGSFSLWDREAGGGMPLFSMATYPLLNPTNVSALFLSENNFYLFKLIEPFFFGIFFMAFLLLEGFNFSMTVACFGALSYMGLIISRGGGSPMAQSPQFLIGCAFFPAMVYGCVKYKDNPIKAASLIGVVIALMFLMAGVTQFPQTIIWWTFFFTIYVFHKFKKHSLLKRTILWGITLFSLVFISCSLFGIQFFPTAFYTLNESPRVDSWYHSINSFPIYPCTYFRCLSYLVSRAVLGTDGISSRAIHAIFILCVILMVRYWPNIRNILKENSAYSYLWGTAVMYFIFPTIVGTTAKLLPFLRPSLKIMSSFTFAYGVHFLDFCIILTLCFLITKIPQIEIKRSSIVQKLIMSLVIIPAFLWGVIPVIVKIFPVLSIALNKIHTGFEILYPSALKGAIVIAFVTTIWFWYLIFRPQYRWLKLLCSFGLILIGFMSLYTCWSWFGRGAGVNTADFALSSPEHVYYQKQKGKFYLPYSEAPTMCHNYSLMYGIKSTCGFLAVPPYRYEKYLRFFNKQTLGPSLFDFGHVYPPPASVTTYFPAEFTSIKKGRNPRWPGFKKVIDGEKYDMWERSISPSRVIFADQLIIRKFEEIMTVMGTDPLKSTLAVEEKDARVRNIYETQLSKLNSSQVNYTNFKQVRDDALSFDVKTKGKVFVMVPEMFQSGWELIVNGRKQKLFPAWYLFLGFQLEAGDHHVQLRYLPPGIYLGIFLSLLALGYLVYLFKFKNEDDTPFNLKL